MLTQEQQQELRLAIRGDDPGKALLLMSRMGANLNSVISPDRQTVLSLLAKKGASKVLLRVMEEEWEFDPHQCDRGGETVALALARNTFRTGGWDDPGQEEEARELFWKWMVFGPKDDGDVYRCLSIIMGRNGKVQDRLASMERLAGLGWDPARAISSDGRTLWNLLAGMCGAGQVKELAMMARWLAQFAPPTGQMDEDGRPPSFVIASLLAADALRDFLGVIDFKATNCWGMNLFWAENRGNSRAAHSTPVLNRQWRELLLQQGVDICQRDQNGGTLLHHLAIHDDLLDEGAGRTTQWLQEQLADIIRLGVALDARDDLGQTALGVAVDLGHIYLVKAFLSLGANPYEEGASMTGDRQAPCTPFARMQEQAWGKLLCAALEHGRLDGCVEASLEPGGRPRM